MAMALRPRDSPSFDDFPVRLAGAGRASLAARWQVTPWPESVVTSLAGFGAQSRWSPLWPVLPALPSPRRPAAAPRSRQPSDKRADGFPANARWPARMRRSDHPSRPSAMTCCFFSSLKTLLTDGG